MRSKYLLVLILITLFQRNAPLFAQSIAGTWKGQLQISNINLPLVFHIKDSASQLRATMDSPEQEAFGIPVDKVSFTQNTLKIQILKAKISYKGTLTSDSMVGTFKQSILKKALVLHRAGTESSVAPILHPQTPKPPFDYPTQEVNFKSMEPSVTLAGTLTMPSNTSTYPVPAVVLISGSGPQDRNESLLGHQPFAVLADYLTRFGIAVLRYDDRGTASSTGTFNGATTYDFAKDVRGAVQFLRNTPGIDTNRIGLIGHSEGGLIAPMVAVEDPRIAFCILMAGPAMSGAELLPLQMERVARASGEWNDTLAKDTKIYADAFQLIAHTRSKLKLRRLLFHYFYRHYAEISSAKNGPGNRVLWAYLEMRLWTEPWMSTFLKINPAEYLQRVKVPILALNGSLDQQVPSVENLAIMRKILKNGDARNAVIELEGLNHLFQECKTGSPKEYAKIEQTMSVVVITEMLNWITKVCNE